MISTFIAVEKFEMEAVCSVENLAKPNRNPILEQNQKRKKKKGKIGIRLEGRSEKKNVDLGKMRE